MEKVAFHFDGTRCTGCKTCVMACKDYNNLSSSFAYRQVYEYEGGSWRKDAKDVWVTDSYAYYISLACNHCAEPACIKACPTGAMHKDDYGFVTVDTKICIGCGYCAFTCPYHAPKVAHEVGHSVKCDGCKDRVLTGGKPVCVEACPQRALDFGSYDEMVSKYGLGMDIAPLPSSKHTSPNLIVTPPVCARKTGNTEGRIINHEDLV